MGDGVVTFHVLGSRGMLGSVVTRRWSGRAEWAEIADADVIVNCVYPDSLSVLESLPLARVIQPSTDAIAERTPYAATKREVERIVTAGGGLVIRSGLVDLRRQPSIAYTNWHVNPLTPLEWADLAWFLRGRRGVHADGREPLTRYAVSLAVAREWLRTEPIPAKGRHLDRIQPWSRAWPSLDVALAAYHEWLG